MSHTQKTRGLEVGGKAHDGAVTSRSVGWGVVWSQVRVVRSESALFDSSIGGGIPSQYEGGGIPETQVLEDKRYRWQKKKLGPCDLRTGRIMWATGYEGAQILSGFSTRVKVN